LDYAYTPTDENLKKLNHTLKAFDAILASGNTKYAAGGNK